VKGLFLPLLFILSAFKDHLAEEALGFDDQLIVMEGGIEISCNSCLQFLSLKVFRGNPEKRSITIGMISRPPSFVRGRGLSFSREIESRAR
jgi:hypothetical protein